MKSIIFIFILGTITSCAIREKQPSNIELIFQPNSISHLNIYNIDPENEKSHYKGDLIFSTSRNHSINRFIRNMKTIVPEQRSGYECECFGDLFIEIINSNDQTSFVTLHHGEDLHYHHEQGLFPLTEHSKKYLFYWLKNKLNNNQFNRYIKCSWSPK